MEALADFKEVLHPALRAINVRGGWFVGWVLLRALAVAPTDGQTDAGKTHLLDGRTDAK